MEDDDEVEDNNKDNKDDKGISALELDRDLGFLRGNQEHWPHDDDDKEEEEDEVDDDQVEDNDKDDKDNKDNNDDKGISAQGLDRGKGFLRGHL